MWKLVSLAFVLLVATPSVAQDDAILSKEDAASMFALSKQAWNQNVKNGAAIGVMTAIQGPSGGLKMGVVKPEGWALVVTAAYDSGDAKPTFLQITVIYPEHMARAFTEPVAKEIEDRSVEELKPDYEVTALHKKTELGFMFTFFIREKAR